MVRTITETVGGVSYEYSPITEETAGLVFGDRNEAYGHPVEDFSKTAGFWTVFKGVAFTPEDVAQMMSLVKVSRQMHRPKRDNPVDNCGYQECLQRIVEARAAGVPITDWEWVAQSVESLLGAVEELDRINELVPPGVSVEDLVACWHAYHDAEAYLQYGQKVVPSASPIWPPLACWKETAAPVIPHDWVERAVNACADARLIASCSLMKSLEDNTAFLFQAANENWSANAVNRFLAFHNQAGFANSQWDAITTMAAADAYNEHWRKVALGKAASTSDRIALIARGTEEWRGG